MESTHEPIRVAEKDWEHAGPVVEYEINRQGQNIHDVRNVITKHVLAYGLQRATDHEGFNKILGAIDLRLGLMEGKFIFFGSIGGAIGWLIMHFLSKKMGL